MEFGCDIHEHISKLLDDQYKVTKSALSGLFSTHRNLRLKLLKASDSLRKIEKAIDIGQAALKEVLKEVWEDIPDGEEKEEKKEEKGIAEEEAEDVITRRRKRSMIISSSDEDNDSVDFRKSDSDVSLSVKSQSINLQRLEKDLPVVKVERISEKEIKKWISTKKQKKAETISEKRRRIAIQRERVGGRFVKPKEAKEKVKEEKDEKKEEEEEVPDALESQETTHQKPVIIQDVWLPVEDRIQIAKPKLILTVTDTGEVQFIEPAQKPDDIEEGNKDKEELINKETESTEAGQIQEEGSTEEINEEEKQIKDTEVTSTGVPEVPEVQSEWTHDFGEQDKENLDPNHLMLNILDPKMALITEEEVARQLDLILREQDLHTPTGSPRPAATFVESPVEVADLWKELDQVQMPLDLSVKSAEDSSKEN